MPAIPGQGEITEFFYDIIAMIRHEHLMYFKDLLEGRASISWNGWFKRNEEDLARELPRAAFLRLKFHKLEEAEKLLKEAGIQFSHSPAAKREKYYSLLHENVLDEKGRPKEAFRRKAYHGAIGYFIDGNPEKGKEILAAFLQHLKRRPVLKRVEELEYVSILGERKTRKSLKILRFEPFWVVNQTSFFPGFSAVSS